MVINTDRYLKVGGQLLLQEIKRDINDLIIDLLIYYLSYLLIIKYSSVRESICCVKIMRKRGTFLDITVYSIFYLKI